MTEDSDEVPWAVPGAPRPHGSCAMRYEDLAAALRANPRRWALVRETKHYYAAASLVERVDEGGSKTWRPAGTFEAVIRFAPAVQVFRVHARYIGAQGAAP